MVCLPPNRRVVLNQEWFLPPRCLAKSRDIFGCHNWGGELLTSSGGQRSGMPLNILQCTGHSASTPATTTMSSPVQNVRSTKGEGACYRMKLHKDRACCLIPLLLLLIAISQHLGQCLAHSHHSINTWGWIILRNGSQSVDFPIHWYLKECKILLQISSRTNKQAREWERSRSLFGKESFSPEKKKDVPPTAPPGTHTMCSKFNTSCALSAETLGSSP